MKLILSNISFDQQDWTKDSIKYLAELKSTQVPVVGNGISFAIAKDQVELSAMPKTGMLLWKVVAVTHIFDGYFDDEMGFVGKDEDIVYVQIDEFTKWIKTIE